MAFRRTWDKGPGRAERAWDHPDNRNGNFTRQNGSATKKREGSRSGEGQVTVSKLDIFTARAWARATLFAGGEMTLHTAVDQLQRDAVASGLVAELGQDEIQHIISAAFATVRHDIGVTACDRDPIEVEPKSDQPRAAANTIEAVVHALRERLIEVSPKQLEDVVVRLSGARSTYPSITDHLLEVLAELGP